MVGGELARAIGVQSQLHLLGYDRERRVIIERGGWVSGVIGRREGGVTGRREGRVIGR